MGNGSYIGGSTIHYIYDRDKLTKSELEKRRVSLVKANIQATLNNQPPPGLPDYLKDSLEKEINRKDGMANWAMSHPKYNEIKEIVIKKRNRKVRKKNLNLR